jgi:hypothetical protein
MINTNNKLIGLIKEEIEKDVELFTKAHLLYNRGLSIKEYNELDRQDKNFYIASVIFCKEEETKNQIALAKFSNLFVKDNNSFDNPTSFILNSLLKEELSSGYEVTYGRKDNDSPIYIQITNKNKTDVKHYRLIED